MTTRTWRSTHCKPKAIVLLIGNEELQDHVDREDNVEDAIREEPRVFPRLRAEDDGRKAVSNGVTVAVHMSANDVSISHRPRNLLFSGLITHTLPFLTSLIFSAIRALDARMSDATLFPCRCMNLFMLASLIMDFREDVRDANGGSRVIVVPRRASAQASVQRRTRRPTSVRVALAVAVFRRDAGHRSTTKQLGGGGRRRRRRRLLRLLVAPLHLVEVVESRHRAGCSGEEKR